MKNKLLPPILFIVLLTAFLTLFWFKEGLLIGSSESGLPFYNLNGQVRFTSFAWTDTNLGYEAALIVGSKPLYWAFSLLENSKIPGFLIESLFFWLIITISSVSIFFLTRELFPEVGNKIAILASFFYLFNPFSLANIWTRFLTTQMVASAALPLLFYLFLLSNIRKKLYFGVLAGFISVFFSFGISSPAVTLLLWGIFSFTTFFYIVTAQKARETFFYLKTFLLTFIIFLIANIWWIAQLIEVNFLKTRFSEINNFFSQGNLDTLSIESQQLGLFKNIFVFLHGIFFTQGQDWAKLFTFKPVLLVEFFLSLVIFFCTYMYRKNQRVLFLSSLFFVGLFLSKGNNLPFGEIFEYFFVKIPVLQAFRNPFEKLGIISVLTGSLLFAKGLHGIFEFIDGKTKNKLSDVIYVFVLLFVLFIWGKPFWTSEVFSSNENIPKEQAKSYKVEVPSYYKEASSWLKNQKGNFRFVSLPLRGEGISYNWEKPYIGVDPSYIFFDSPSISNNTTIPYFTDFASAISNYQLNPTLINFFPASNSRYVLLREDINYLRDHMANPKVVKENIEQMVKDRLLSKVAAFGKLSIYEVAEKWFWPKIYVTSQIVVSNKSSDFSSANKLYSRFPDQTLAVIDSQSVLENKDRFNNWIIKPDKVFFPYIVNSNINVDENFLLSQLPKINYLPGQSGLLSKTKEELEIPFSGVNYWDQLNYKILFIGKKEREIYEAVKQKIDPSKIKELEVIYKEGIDEISSVLIQRNKIGVQIPNSIAQNLLVQYFLARKINNDMKGFLKKLLLDFNIIPKFELPFSENKNYIIYSFDVPKEGFYNLRMENSQKEFKFFLDGQEEVNKTAENNEMLINLNKGRHELAREIDLKEVSMLTDDMDYNLTQITPFIKNIKFGDLPQIYQIDFDYKFISGNNLAVFINDDTNQNLPSYFPQSGNDWRHTTLQYTNNFGAAGASIGFQSDGQVQVQNLRIRRINFFYPILISSNFLTEESTDTTWDFIKVNPAHYLLRINKKNSKEEVLVFSELFDSGWKIYKGKSEDWENIKLEFEWRNKSKEYSLSRNNNIDTKLNGSPAISEFDHFLTNGFGNSWIIKDSGDYYLDFVYVPHQNMEITMAISKISIIMGGIIFILVFIKRKNYEKKN